MTLRASSHSIQNVATGIPFMNLSEGRRGKLYFTLSLLHDGSADRLEVTLSGGIGNSDLYIKFDAIPTTLAYTQRSISSSNSEKISILKPQNGKAFINNNLF